ncbi:hypothetical protein AGR13a_Cc30203 [Agrobacterium genomosp. 13 str. CFBP 6927]|uniref:Uncharacterized protein n=1 Tax=Agrobacterium genomosp. 13 str. CFBP 6927 TaxID=1183428 RepID=A0ABP2BIA5_9HYPH|nr:hypothetical protein AGR13a_Cc30203 [Agrobacterium genomosp. 13 str. CFBP 6927]
MPKAARRAQKGAQIPQMASATTAKFARKYLITLGENGAAREI